MAIGVKSLARFIYAPKRVTLGAPVKRWNCHFYQEPNPDDILRLAPVKMTARQSRLLYLSLQISCEQPIRVFPFGLRRAFRAR
jgi:hypothetical protein